MQNSLYNIQKSRSLLDSINEKISTQMNYNRPSDDPVAARLLVGIADQLKTGEQYTSNITKANNWLQVTSTALTGLSDTLKQAKKLVATVSSGTTDTAVRQNTISQLKALRQQVVDIANTQSGEQYVFSGTKSDTAPFVANGAPPPSFVYQGNGSAIDIAIDNNATQTMNITGDRVISGSNTTPYQYGNTDIIDTFDKMITAVTNNDVSSAVGIQAMAAQLDDGATQINNAQVDVAARQSRLTIAQEMNTNTKTALDTVVSNTQTADTYKLAVELTQQQTALQATLSATAKVSQMSLLDYL
jgi:flagellar hook-associated protein 3 FlgL